LEKKIIKREKLWDLQSRGNPRHTITQKTLQEPLTGGGIMLGQKRKRQWGDHEGRRKKTRPKGKERLDRLPQS